EIKGDIEFKNVSFRYDENHPYILKDINLKIPHGSTVAIMGYTGIGKTTFVNLLPRLYDVTDGQLLIDRKDIRTIPLDVLRREVGLVQQESFMFSDSVLNNISYGLRDIDKSRVEKVSGIAHFDKDVEEFPLKYETMVGER